MFTVEESALLARMLRVVGWTAVGLVAAIACYLCLHYHLLAHAWHTWPRAAGVVTARRRLRLTPAGSGRTSARP